jgi:hypothetical protein
MQACPWVFSGGISFEFLFLKSKRETENASLIPAGDWTCMNVDEKLRRVHVKQCGIVLNDCSDAKGAKFKKFIKDSTNRKD